MAPVKYVVFFFRSKVPFSGTTWEKAMQTLLWFKEGRLTKNKINAKYEEK
jgi:hypothetical protein